MDLPQDPKTKETQGFAFIEFSSKENAQVAAEMANGHEFDKKHTLSTIIMSDFARIVDTPDEWTPPEQKNLQSWLLDPDCNDQYALRHTNMVRQPLNNIIARERERDKKKKKKKRRGRERGREKLSISGNGCKSIPSLLLPCFFCRALSSRAEKERQKN